MLAAYKKPMQDQGVDDVTLSLAPERLQLAGSVKLMLPGVLLSRQCDGNPVRKLATFGTRHTLNLRDVPECAAQNREKQ